MIRRPSHRGAVRVGDHKLEFLGIELKLYFAS
jgi:hypothetical protein